MLAQAVQGNRGSIMELLKTPGSKIETALVRFNNTVNRCVMLLSLAIILLSRHGIITLVDIRC